MKMINLYGPNFSDRMSRTSLHYIAMGILDLNSPPGEFLPRRARLNGLGRSEAVRRVKWLLRKGAILKPDKWGCTPIHLAASHNQSELMDIFFRNGADPFDTLLRPGTYTVRQVISTARNRQRIQMLLTVYCDNKLYDKCVWRLIGRYLDKNLG
jgi:hypothetical protein